MRTARDGLLRSEGAGGWTHPLPLLCRRHAAAVAQVALLLAGVGLLAWACVDLRFRGAEGFPQGGICVPVAAAAALLAVGVALRSRFLRPALWFGLALVGQAAALQLIDAGHSVRYQHYRPLTALLTGPDRFLVACLVVQAALVFAALPSAVPGLVGWCRRHVGGWQLAAIGLLFCLTSATLSRDPSLYVTELCVATFVQVVGLANVLVLAAAVPEEAGTSLRKYLLRWFGSDAEHSSPRSAVRDPFALGAALWVTVLAILLGWLVYEYHPHIPDEVCYLSQARYLAEGRLAMPAPPVPSAFAVDLMTFEETRWYSCFPPGWPAMLAVGVVLGVPWLVNPVLAGVNVLLVFALLRRLYDRSLARLAVVLLCLSPWYVLMAMNLLAHTATLTCALLAALAIEWARDGGRPFWAGVAGAAIGLASLIRPLDGVILAGLFGLWAVGVGGSRLRAVCLLALALGVLATGGLVLPYNAWLTGDPLRFPVVAYFDRVYGSGTNAMGFGPQRGVGWTGLDPLPGHGLLDVLINGNMNLFSVNGELLGWSTGSLLLATLAVRWGWHSRADRLMLAAALGVVGAHTFYWFSGGPDFGARYWYLLLVPCIALTVRGVRGVASRLDGDGVGSAWRVLAGVAVLGLAALLTYIPWRALDKYHRYRGMSPELARLATECGWGKCLVLVRGNRHPDYASAAVYNPVDLDAPVPVYAWDRGPEVREQLLRAYPDRPVWIVEGPTITHQGYRIVEGPLCQRGAGGQCAGTAR